MLKSTKCPWEHWESGSYSMLMEKLFVFLIAAFFFNSGKTGNNLIIQTMEYYTAVKMN